MSFPLTWGDRVILLSMPISISMAVGAYTNNDSNFNLFILFFIIMINTGHFYLLLSLSYSRRVTLEAAAQAIEAQNEVIMDQHEMILKHIKKEKGTV